jgi:hypothetical protein
MGDVVLSFNAVAHNSTGLTWAAGYLWNIGHGHDVPAELHKLDPTDGSEILRYVLPIEHVMGLTWDGNAFWAVSHETSIIYQLYANNGSIIKSFQSPNLGTVETGCAGLAWDGQYLWYADKDYNKIYQLDPADGTEIYSFPSPGAGKPEGLAWDGAYLWLFEYNLNMIYQLDTTDGSVRTSFSSPANGEGDLAWDGNYLWLSLNAVDTIYKIEITNPGFPVAIANKPEPVSEGDIVQFNGSTSYDPNGFITTYEWDFDASVDSDGDGFPTNDTDATGPTPTYIYGDDGVYDVILTVTDNQSYTDTDTCIINVNNLAPTIEPFGPYIIGQGNPLDLNVNATDPGSDDLTFTWRWGDGTLDTISIFYNDGVGTDPDPSPWGTFPFTVTDMANHIYDIPGYYIINLTVQDDDGGINYYSTNITVINNKPPDLYINVSFDQKDVNLNWNSLSTFGVNHYLIYRSKSQTDFDFDQVWVDTSKDCEPGESTPISLRTMWNDTNSADPGNVTNFETEYYYIIRAVNILGDISKTSRTVGKFTRVFPGGISSFSLPLQPLEIIDTDTLASSMNADYIRYLNSTTHNWDQHDLGGGTVNNIEMKLGEGYEIKFQNQTYYTFCGMPTAMIQYEDIPLGFDVSPGGNSGELTATANSVSETVIVNWQKPPGMDSLDQYLVLRSSKRDGFWGIQGVDYVELATLPHDVLFYMDEGNATPGSQLYYMIVPINSSTSEQGSGSYSLGIWTKEIDSQYDTFGLPVKMSEGKTADWFCDNIPDTVGINYHYSAFQRWRWHSTRMPEGAFDPTLEIAEGYQISTSGSTKFSFIGV